jgi:hypothetical protein
MSEHAAGWSRRALLDASWRFGLGSAAAALGGGGRAAGAAVSRPIDALRVRGNGLSYNGQRVRLRGVAISDPLLARKYRPASDFALLASDAWRCNVVRISVLPSTWQNRQVETMALLERDVTAALANGLFVIIDWHAIGWPDGYFERPLPGWGMPEDAYVSTWVLAASFWQAMAERWGADGRIAFELWNEPIHTAAEYGLPAGTRWRELKPAYQALLAIIRAKSRNVVIAAGDRYAHDLRGIRQDPLAGENIAYSWHVYAGADGKEPMPLAEKLDELDREHPVVVTEWGFAAGSKDRLRLGKTHDQFAREFMRDFLNQRRLSWTAWCWHPHASPMLLEKDWRTPTAYGRFVQTHLRYEPSVRT